MRFQTHSFHSPARHPALNCSRNAATAAAGVAASFAIIRDQEIRRDFRRRCRGVLPEISALGLEACRAVYTDADGGAEEWRRGLLAQLDANCDMVEDAVVGWRGVEMVRPEATYLAWLDCTALGLSDPAGHMRAAGVGLSDGQAFGAPRGWLRLNFGAPAVVVAEGLRRLGSAMPR